MTDPNPYLSQLSASQRKLLQLSIQINPMLVANADGHYSMRESTALQGAIGKLISEEEYRPVMLLAGSEPISEAALRVYLEEHSADIEGYLQQISGLLQGLPEETAAAYRKFTLYSIVAVAEASRDGLFGLMGDRISTSEKKVMKRMVEVLDLPINEAIRLKLGMV